MTDTAFWRAKVAAFIHDPASKALILMRGMAHEKGSVEALRQEIFEDSSAVASLEAVDTIVKRADHWASAADRPSLPMTLGSRINFVKKPELVHPLTGKRFVLSALENEDEMKAQIIEALNFTHFSRFIVKEGDDIDWRRTFLTFWRFGSVEPAPEIGLLWQALPADTRSPDHSIWDHVGLTSAFAGALHQGGDSGAALLVMSFGPVQGFIAQARSTSDLWAGSHLLSSLVWQGMKVICDRYGPDAILFPALRGVPLVDIWLRNEVGLEDLWPEELSYPTGASDANPLFAAALPNRFLALVPAGEGEGCEIAEEVKTAVRKWVKVRVDEVLNEIGLADEGSYAKEQVKRQLEIFPEVNWSLVPWDLALGEEGKLDDSALVETLKVMGHPGDYLDAIVKGLVRKEIEIEGSPFFLPNPGVAYPGLFELGERLHTSAKSARPFSGSREEGYRCSVCGEREWLTNNKEELKKSRYERKNTVWNELASEFSFIKEGEHLCSWCALKRFWPRLFVRWVKRQLIDIEHVNRYVISTHTMSLSTSMWDALDEEGNFPGNKGNIKELIEEYNITDTAALPAKLYKRLRKGKDLELGRKLPILMDILSDEEDEQKRRQAEKVKGFLKGTPEMYYGFILMDGDRMGRWLAAVPGVVPKLGDRFHETVKEELRAKGLNDYLEAPRPSSPAWHQAISGALNNFSVGLARVVVEEMFMGKLIYAGGDDLMAMVAVHDLPGLMLALRCVYSGTMPWGGEAVGKQAQEQAWQWLSHGTVPENISIRLANGFALLKLGKGKSLLRLMGEKATASMGAVIAHHKTPLARVLTELRSAEERAKTKGGRDAFSIALMKRSGGQTSITGKWRLEPDIKSGDMGLLIRARDFLALSSVSRRAAYILSEVVRDIPAKEDALTNMIRHHFFRQGREAVKTPEIASEVERLAKELAARALDESAVLDETVIGYHTPGAWLHNLFIAAEFLARERRTPKRAIANDGGKE